MMSAAPPELTPIERARELVLERVERLPAEDVPLRDAVGRFLDADVAASEDIPAFDNSAMDGYAVRAADTSAASRSEPVRLRLAGESSAGHPAQGELREGEAFAISTGAAIPAGADAVVRVEDTSREDEVVSVMAAVGERNNIREAGEDVRAGDPVLAAGARLGGAELGAHAAIGIPLASCARRPRLSLLLTGDELVEPGEHVGPGQIRDSNAYAVPPLAAAAGAEVTSVEIAPDHLDGTIAALDRALGADVVVVCGGDSVGEHDHVRPALEQLGVEQVFWRVSLRPGKPTYFGVGTGGKLVFGLPGNPVSAMVTFLLFVRPALLSLQGGDTELPRVEAAMSADYEKVEGRAEAVRVRLGATEGGWRATPTGAQGSHVLTSMIGADGLAMIPTEVDVVRAGERVVVELLGWG